MVIDMGKYKTVYCDGYWDWDKDKTIYEVKIALDSWDEVEDEEDERIFYYMDGDPLRVGTVLTDGFVITNMEIENA
jgi:hypothetical protein